MLILAAQDGGFHYFMLTLHILFVVLGFGPIALSGLEAGRSAGGVEGAAVVRSHWTVSRDWAMWSVYLVFVTGIVLILTSDDRFSFSDAWLSAAMGVYIVGIGAFHMLLAPARKQLRSGSGDTVAAAKRLALAAAVMDVVLVVNLVLMVWNVR